MHLSILIMQLNKGSQLTVILLYIHTYILTNINTHNNREIHTEIRIHKLVGNHIASILYRLRSFSIYVAFLQESLVDLSPYLLPHIRTLSSWTSFILEKNIIIHSATCKKYTETSTDEYKRIYWFHWQCFQVNYVDKIGASTVTWQCFW